MKARTGDITLHYEKLGRSGSEPVVFVHGFPFNHQMWSPQVQHLQEEYQTITYDVRGHGLSDVGDGQYMLEFFVDDLIGLLDHLRFERTNICGLSMGGYIALRAVEREPARFNALVICDSSSEADTNEAKLRRAATMKTVKERGVDAFADTFLKAVLSPETFERKPDTVQFVRRMITANSAVGICGTLQALAARTETTSSLPLMKLPTLVMVGELDKLTPPALSEMMHGKLPNSELQVIPRAAHLSNLENSEEFNQHLLKFLENT